MPTELTPLLRVPRDPWPPAAQRIFQAPVLARSRSKDMSQASMAAGDRLTADAGAPLAGPSSSGSRASSWRGWLRRPRGRGRKPLARGVVRVRAQRRPQPDGRVPGPQTVARMDRGSLSLIAPGRADRSGGRAGDGGDRSGCEHGVSEAADGRGDPRRRCCGHAGVWGRVPGIPGQALSGLADRGSGRSAARGRQTDSV